LLNAILGGYIFINATQYHYIGVTDITNINALGKVIQYDMQNEDFPEYASVAQITNRYRAHGGDNPYDLLAQNPPLRANHYELVGAYARSTFLRHPGEFLGKSLPVALYPGRLLFSMNADPQAPFGKILLGLQSVYHMLYRLNIVFPLCAGVWIFLLCRRQTAKLPLVKGVGVLVLLVLYGIVVTTTGGYGSYTRLHMPFIPLLTIVVWEVDWLVYG